MFAFIPVINGLGFTYIGAKEFNSNWIKEGLIYEIPWFLLFLCLYNDGLAAFFAGLGLMLMVICIIRTIFVYTKHKDVLIDDDPESRVDIEKSFRSYWVILSFIMFLNGLGLIFVGFRRNVQRWVLEGAFFEFLWILYIVLFAVDKNLGTLVIPFTIIGWILSIVRTFMVYFEEERMDNDLFAAPKPVADTPKPTPAPIVNEDNQSSQDIIPQFRHYNREINDLKDTFNQKEENIKGLINKRFNSDELTYDRFMSVIENCRKLFDHQADSALSIIHLAPEYSVRLDETVKGKISIMEGIIEEMNNLIEEFIIHDGADEQSDEELKELFSNMDNLICSVKDYK